MNTPALGLPNLALIARHAATHPHGAGAAHRPGPRKR